MTFVNSRTTISTPQTRLVAAAFRCLGKGTGHRWVGVKMGGGCGVRGLENEVNCRTSSNPLMAKKSVLVAGVNVVSYGSTRTSLLAARSSKTLDREWSIQQSPLPCICFEGHSDKMPSRPKQISHHLLSNTLRSLEFDMGRASREPQCCCLLLGLGVERIS